MNTTLMFSSETDLWATPQNFFDELNKEFRFTLDPCSNHENRKCDKYYTIEDNGLLQDWQGETVFCNPPYGKPMKDWVRKCYEESLKPNTLVVMLIPARTDTSYFHQYIYNKARDIRFIKGRLKFGDAVNAAPFPSMLVVFTSNPYYRTSNRIDHIIGLQNDMMKAMYRVPVYFTDPFIDLNTGLKKAMTRERR